MADVRRQLRSGTVVLGGMGLLAVALTACSSEPDKRCVDRDSYNAGKGYKVVADKNCTSATTSSGGTWYYGGSKKSGWIDSGSFTRPSGSGGSGGGVHRGGFGGGKGGSGG
ncbi:hypothetical protein ACH4S8_28720 [Streptomyces sp. NPDC021080]|uniref:hypothetical protein n=1 Tax=Streptomyces sp. NPDC021080 TaxID=3365110 RepID=UPI0037B0FC7D